MSKTENQNMNKEKTTLSAPWGNSQSYSNECINEYSAAVCKRDGHGDGAKEFVRERTRLHEIYIKEKEKTKRIFLSIAALLFIASLLVVVFAPEGRETISYWVGATLLLFAGGAAGFTQLQAKGPSVGFSANKTNIG